MHYIIWPIAQFLQQTIIFKRFIDDIIWISQGEKLTNSVKEKLTSTFQEGGLELIFREISTHEPAGSCVEFLDVNHRIDDCAPGGFVTTDYIKPTARGRVFLNGGSFHPTHVFRSIVFGEAIRMRRLNELQQDYIDSLQRLRLKCAKSNFRKSITNKIIDLAKTWEERFGPKNKNSQDRENKTKRLIWATPFSTLFTLSQKEKKLIPHACIIYKKPATIQSMLTNYRRIALNIQTSSKTRNGSSSPCNKCALCGNHGQHSSMVQTVNAVTNKDGISIHLFQNLNCFNFGIYAAQCTICNQLYIGQTKNKFSVRWAAHRSFWNNKFSECNNTDQAALLKHYHNYHYSTHANKPKISDCYNVIFLEEPQNINRLDICESRWIHKLKAEININQTILPIYR